MIRLNDVFINESLGYTTGHQNWVGLYCTDECAGHTGSGAADRNVRLVLRTSQRAGRGGSDTQRSCEHTRRDAWGAAAMSQERRASDSVDRFYAAHVGYAVL